MMQANITSGQDRQTVLGEIIHLMATSSDPRQPIERLLQLAQRETGALSVGLVLFDDPQVMVTIGESELWAGREIELQQIASTLPPGFSTSPHNANGLAAPLYDRETLLGLLWTSFQSHHSISQSEKDFLLLLLDALKILAVNLHTREIHERSHQLTMSLLHSISDPLLVLDDDRRLLLMNPSAESVFGITASDARGKPLREIVHSEELTALAEEGKTLPEWVSPNNKTFMPRLQIVQDGDGHIEGWVLALRDVTQFKKLNRNQNEFMRIVSHDLRSPLTSMQGFASMLELGLVGDLNEKQKHFVSKILSGITQMTALVDNIQDAGRFDPETGFYELTRSQCDLGEMVRRIVDNHLVPAEKSLGINVSVDDSVPVISADTNMLERAIINLFDNAIKYTPSGGKIDISVKRVNADVLVAVKDTGYGISAEGQKHLFERHVRIPREEHKKIKGSGLGLFIVRSVAQRHGGDAWVESKEGQGSVFYLRIPLEGSNLVTANA